jgi:hypothetical protein
MRAHIGIDPGMSGGLSCVSTDLAEAVIMPTHSKDEVKTWGSPLDFHAIFLTLQRWQRQHPGVRVTIEKAQSMPKQGIVSAFNYGAGYGGLLCVLQALTLEYRLVRPTVWKKGLLGDENTVGKAGSIAFALETYPALDLRRTPRCTTYHDGMADALCLATYGLRTWT